MIAHLILGLTLTAAGLSVILFRGSIGRAVLRKRSKPGVLTNPLYYLAIGYPVLLAGLTFAISALVGFYG